MWSVAASTASLRPGRQRLASRACSLTSATSPAFSGRTGSRPGTVRVRVKTSDSANADAAMPRVSHTDSATAPTPSSPSPEPAGSDTASRTPESEVSRCSSANHEPPPLVILPAVARPVTM